jgi:uncharacterized membrane protein YkvA (DUF1232 family)
MGRADEHIATLQRFIDEYPRDVAEVHSALDRNDLPDLARRVLLGALNYGLDLLDIFPDHYRGLGLADDAVVIRLAARHAVDAGAAAPVLSRLAAEAPAVEQLFAELAKPLDLLVQKLPEREVRGRTVSQILAQKDVRAVFDADIQRAISALKPTPIDTSSIGGDGALNELKRMTRASLKKAGLVS